MRFAQCSHNFNHFLCEANEYCKSTMIFVIKLMIKLIIATLMHIIMPTQRQQQKYLHPAFFFALSLSLSFSHSHTRSSYSKSIFINSKNIDTEN